MELGTKIFLARVDIEREFLDKYKNSPYTSKVSTCEMTKKLRTLKVELSKGDFYTIDDWLGDKEIESGLYATCYPMINKLFIFEKHVKELSVEAFRHLFRHEFLHVIQVAVLNMYEESYFDPHGDAFKEIARVMRYPEEVALGGIELTNIK